MKFLLGALLFSLFGVFLFSLPVRADERPKEEYYVEVSAALQMNDGEYVFPKPQQMFFFGSMKCMMQFGTNESGKNGIVQVACVTQSLDFISINAMCDKSTPDDEDSGYLRLVTPEKNEFHLNVGCRTTDKRVEKEQVSKKRT